MYILGINFSHHGSICLLKDGEVVLFLEEERLSRHKAGFISDKSHNVLLKIKDYTDKLDYICVGIEHNLLEHIVEDELLLNYNVEIIKELSDNIFSKYLEVKREFINEYDEDPNRISKVNYINLIWEELSKLTTPETKLYIDLYSHHNLPANQTFYNSGFEEAVCVVVDGRGTGKRYDYTNTLYERESIWKFNYEEYSQLYCNYAIDKNGIGSTYSKVTGELGFNKGFEEGKTMGLSSYLPHQMKDPTMMINVVKANILQKWSQEKVLDLIKYAITLSGNKNVCLSGGYGLNCVANYYFRKNLPSDINLYCEPIANDAGQAMGSAQKLYHKVTGDKTIRPQKSIYYGPIPEYWNDTLAETPLKTN